MAHDLVSLITVLDGVLHPTNHKNPLLKSSINLLKKPVTTVINRIFRRTDREDRILDDRLLLESLLEKATCLMDLLEKSSMQHGSRGNKEIVEAIQREVRDAAHEAEDVIESHAMGQLCGFLTCTQDRFMSEVMQRFDVAKEELMQIIKDDHQSCEEAVIDVINPALSVAADPKSSKPNISMVGFDGDALHLKNRLTSERREREIIPIVGMGGIGKTTLARNLYNDPLIVSHFDVRAWATVSQDHNVRAILLGLLRCIVGNISDDVLRQNDSNLGDMLYRRLCVRRYLVVLDDVWSKEAWDEIRCYFPKENHRSRILVASRELDVAKHPDSACEEHQMHLLSDAQGWDLLRQKVFDAKNREYCPPLLKEMGEKIVSDCGGLPLAISVIGGILSENKYSKDLWERVAENVRAVLSHGDEYFSKILSLSYDNLPLHLKPCFLYMAAFPEDFEVRRSKLVKLWVAEGFLSRPSGSNKSLEDVGNEYLKALVDRNLISVADTYYIGRPKSYTMHDLLRDLSVRKADEEKFLLVVTNGKVNSFQRVSAHLFTKDAPRLAEQHHLSLSRSLLCITPRFHEINISPILSTLKLVRVLDLCNIPFRKFPRKILKLANLRFLAVKCRESLPSGIWRLRNLQTLFSDYFNSEAVILPHEAWELPGLRHIIVKLSTIFIDFKVTRVHENLQTIVGISLHDLLASNLINSIPNVKKLGIHDNREDDEDIIIDLRHMYKLESLKLSGHSWYPYSTLDPFNLPNCLKKLHLIRYTIPTRFLNNVVGALQYLEVLKISQCHFQSEEQHDDEEWELNEGVEFCSLQYLELDSLRIARWKADDSHFPRLKHLMIRNCLALDEIPTSIGEISTLEMIDVDYHRSHVAWAEEIQETQRSEYGNDSLQIRVPHY